MTEHLHGMSDDEWHRLDSENPDEGESLEARARREKDDARPPAKFRMGNEIDKAVVRLQKFSGREQAAEKAAPAAWQPPAVATYGKGFDAAAIPRRRWILGNQYAAGEVTALVSPMACNKSMKLETDAVSIVTGRSLLADPVHRTGEVLFLVGEDARRDFEARLAGILEYYRIDPAELGDRLHVVYLGEVDAGSYSLAHMIADMAVLNREMFEWLRDYPELVAVFIDPMVAWHRLVENDNQAMQLLCSTFRALAVQGDLAVIFNHHTTKLSQFDCEAHVRNPTAIRGGSSIGNDARWAFTLARLKPETATQFGISEEERRRYRRFDGLKASHGADDDLPRLLRVESVPIANGETVGVLVEVNTGALAADGIERQKAVEQEQRTALTAALTAMLRERSPRSVSDAATWLTTRAPTTFTGKRNEPASDRTVRRNLPAAIGSGLATSFNGKAARIVVSLTGEGHGARQQVNLEQASLT